jgi:uncharacterized membrane protein
MFRLTTLRTVASILNIAPWKLAVGGAVVFAGVLAVTVLAAGLFLLILPAVLIAVGIAALLAPRAKPGVPVAPMRGGPQIIEVEYEVVEHDRESRR